jgi:hypothetical protein
MKQAIISTNPIKAKVMKTFKDTANCFRKFVYLGNNEISESEIKEIK